MVLMNITLFHEEIPCLTEYLVFYNRKEVFKMENFIQVDGLKVRYLEEGSGPAVILLHGASLGSSADVWEGTLGPLAEGGFHPIAYDQPGFGLSENPQDYGVPYRTQFIMRFMDAIEADRACLIGHSQAGGMAVRLAFDHPDRISRVVAAGCGSMLPSLPDQSGSGGAGEGQEGGKSLPTLEDTRKILENNLFNKSLITTEVLEKRQRMSLGKNFEAFIERSKAPKIPKESVPLWQRLKEIPVPLLLLYGFQDRGSAAMRCALLKEREPSLRLEMIDRASHLIMWDAGKVFNEKVINFLSA